MAKNMICIILILGSLHGFWAEGFPPVNLTASRSAIIETASVILTCEGRRSSRCLLYTVSGGANQDFSCNQTFTGTELLQMAKRSAPAKVELSCCFPGQSESCSHYSDRLFINVQPVPGPEFTVNPAVITETDTVTLTCVASSSFSVSMCYLFILFESKGLERNISCHQTLRGAELLQMINMESRRLPANLKVNCRYRAEPGQVLSEFGNPSSILIQDEAKKKTHVTTFIPSQTSTGPTSRTSTGPTSRTSTGPTSRTSTGPTSRTSTGPTSRTESNNNPTDGFAVDKVSSAPLSDLRILKILLVAITGFGSVLGIILLLFTVVICQITDEQEDSGKPGEVKKLPVGDEDVYQTVAYILVVDSATGPPAFTPQQMALLQTTIVFQSTGGQPNIFAIER